MVFTSLFRRANSVLILLVVCFWNAGCTHRVIPSSLRDPTKNTAVRPVPRDAEWRQRHEGFREIARSGAVNVLFLGDSITDGWRRIDEKRGGKLVWDQEWAPLSAANFGIGGDRTQHVLWRIENGELDGIKPKVVVLLIGTNNTGLEADKKTPRNSPAEVVAGLEAIMEALRSRLPESSILLLAIFPRGESPHDPLRAYRDQSDVGPLPRWPANLLSGYWVRFPLARRLAQEGIHA